MTPAVTGRACTLYAVLAARSPIAVIFRRGPSKHTCMIRWNRADDTFHLGQWFKGSVYPERSALSPDGTHLLAFMATFKPPFRTWTVLSRPPYFTALALWPKGDTWGGGGYFLSDREFVLHHNALQSALAPGYALPGGFVMLPPGAATDEGVKQAFSRDPRAWWAKEGPDKTYASRTFTRDGPSGVGLFAYWQAEEPRKAWTGGLCFALTQRKRRVALADVRWVEFDANADLLFSRGGRLYRCPATALGDVATCEDVVARSRLLADFTDLTFRALVAPYATASRADGEGALPTFAPILDRVTKEDRRARQRARKP